MRRMEKSRKNLIKKITRRTYVNFFFLYNYIPNKKKPVNKLIKKNEIGHISS